MPIERFKDITINGNQFRLNLLPANVGSWCSAQLISGRFAEFEVYQRIQNYMLNACLYLKPNEGEPIPMKIYTDGKWLIPSLDLEFDIDTIDQIYRKSLSFNFDDFFGKLESRGDIVWKNTKRNLSQTE